MAAVAYKCETEPGLHAQFYIFCKIRINLMSIILKNTVIEYPVFLAPMAGITDYAFRKICRHFGASFTFTEMISANAIHYNDKKTALLAKLYEDEHPIGVQIFGSDPDIMAEAAYKIANSCYHGCESRILPAAIDINMGCPVKKVVSNNEGSALMKFPERIFKIVDAVARSVDIPITVKMRAGWDKDSLNAPECASAAESAGASLVCVHGRTREQMYSPPVNFEIIKRVKETVKIPVIGNGGIYTAEDALRMMQETGCDGVAIARGARGDPQIFSKIIAKIKGEEYRTPTNEEILNTAIAHLELLAKNKGEEVAYREARGQLIWYVKGLRGAAYFREKINSAKTKAEIIALIEKIKEENS